MTANEMDGTWTWDEASETYKNPKSSLVVNRNRDSERGEDFKFIAERAEDGVAIGLVRVGSDGVLNLIRFSNFPEAPKQ